MKIVFFLNKVSHSSWCCKTFSSVADIHSKILDGHPPWNWRLLWNILDPPLLASSGSGGGEGAIPPRPVKYVIKNGHPRRLHRFHVSRPHPRAAGSATGWHIWKWTQNVYIVYMLVSDCLRSCTYFAVMTLVSLSLQERKRSGWLRCAILGSRTSDQHRGKHWRIGERRH